MKRNFLLTLLLTLLPFVGWAAEPQKPADADLVISTNNPTVNLVVAGSDDSGTFYYYSSDNSNLDFTAEELEQNFGADVPTANSEGTYYVYWFFLPTGQSFDVVDEVYKIEVEVSEEGGEPVVAEYDSYDNIVVTVNPTRAGFTGNDIAFPTVSVKGLLNGVGEPTDVPTDYYTVAWTYGSEAVTVANAVGTYTVTVTAKQDYAPFTTFEDPDATFEVVAPSEVDVQVIPVTSATMIYGGEIKLTAENANNVITLQPADYNTLATKQLIIDKLKINEAAALATQNVGDQYNFTLGLKDNSDNTVEFDEFTTLTIKPTGTGKVDILPAENELTKINDELLTIAVANGLVYNNTDQNLVVGADYSFHSFGGEGVGAPAYGVGTVKVVGDPETVTEDNAQVKYTPITVLRNLPANELVENADDFVGQTFYVKADLGNPPEGEGRLQLYSKVEGAFVEVPSAHQGIWAAISEIEEEPTQFEGIEFFVSDEELTADAETGLFTIEEEAWEDNATRKNAGTYYVYARAAADESGDGNWTAGPAEFVGETEIAKATPVLAGRLALTGAGDPTEVANSTTIAGNYTCTYSPDLTITATGVTADPTFASPFVKYYVSRQVGNNWGTEAELKVDDPATTDENEKTVFNAGTYRISAKIVPDADGNWDAVTDENYALTLTVNKADAITDDTKPAGLELTYNGEAQELVTVGEGVPAGVIEYRMRRQTGTNQWGQPTWPNWPNNWSREIPEATNANTYQIQYRIQNNENYKTVNATNATIVTTTIKKSLLAIKVNNVTKVYDATNAVTNANTQTVEKDGARFTLLNETFRDGADEAQILGVNYAPMAEGTGITVAGSPYEITVTKEALTARNANYDYEVIPGTLTITPAEIYVQTQRYPVLPNGDNNYGIDRYTTTYGVPADFSQAYTVHGLQGDDTAEDVFETLPVLTAPEALPADNPEVGVYDFVFTPGVLNNTNYVLDEEEPYRVWTNGTMTDHFTVQAVGDSRIVITIVPQTAVYNYGAAPEITWVAGTNYYVTGLQGDDEISTVFKDGAAPQINIKKYVEGEEVDIESYDAGQYALEYAENLELANPTRYAGGIQFINATLTIEPRPLTGVVESQTILLDGEIDEEAFEIKDGETVVDPEELDLNAELDENADASINGPGVYDNGLILTIDNPNFVLEEDTEYGQLTILSLTEIVLNPDEAAASIIEVAATAVDDDDDPVEFKVTLGEDFPVMKAGEWYTMVLPFEVNTLDLVKKLNTYVIVNRLGASTTDHISFVLESDAIPAGEPFVIKCNKDATFANLVFESVTITDEIEDYSDPKYSDNALVGVYAATDIQSTDAQMLAWLGNSTIVKNPDADPVVYRQNKWYEPYSAPKTIAPFEAYLKYAPGKTGAGVRMITFEEADGTITAINGVEGENGANAEGLYRIDGVKVQGTTTQKGVYIQDGKKFVK